MQIRLASLPGSGAPNEDWAGATPSSAVVLDGLTAPPELDTGCRHGVPWFVDRLGSSLLKRLTVIDSSLTEVLRLAIEDVSRLHSNVCDLTNPGTPSATVAIVRTREGIVEWLVLADAAILLETGDGVRVITDERVNGVATMQRRAALAQSVSAERKQDLIRDLVSAQRQVRNRPGGYWIAGSDPDAANEATVGALPLREGQRYALLTDGVTRLVEFGELSWDALFESLDRNGPASVLDVVRIAEASDPELARWPRYKPSDDATAVFVNL